MFSVKVMPSIRTRFNDVPILLVGTKCDTRVGENVFVDGSEMRVHVSSASPTYEQVQRRLGLSW